jgi:vancomycin permeability regulator SanA
MSLSHCQISGRCSSSQAAYVELSYGQLYRMFNIFFGLEFVLVVNLQKEVIIIWTYVRRVWRKIQHLPVPALQLVLGDLHHITWVFAIQQDLLRASNCGYF